MGPLGWCRLGITSKPKEVAVSVISLYFSLHRQLPWWTGNSLDRSAAFGRYATHHPVNGLVIDVFGWDGDGGGRVRPLCVSETNRQPIGLESVKESRLITRIGDSYLRGSGIDRQQDRAALEGCVDDCHKLCSCRWMRGDETLNQLGHDGFDLGDWLIC